MSAGMALLGAAAGTAAQPVSATLVAPFQESVQEEVKVSGTVIVGIASTGVLAGAVLMSGFIVPGESPSVCLTVRSRDGVYFSRNEFEVPGGLPAGATGFLLKTVAKGSPADLMGLRGGTTYATIGGEGIVLGGDIVLTVDGIPAGSAANIRKIRDKLGAARPGTEFKSTILRAGRVLELSGRVP